MCLRLRGGVVPCARTTVFKEALCLKKNTSNDDFPLYLFKQGTNFEAQRYLGSHLTTENGQEGAMFRVWAPRAKAVSVVGDFNDWKPGAHPMTNHDDSGVWTCFIPGIQKFDVYKYCVTTVSYTHLDVNKRQRPHRAAVRSRAEPPADRPSKFSLRMLPRQRISFPYYSTMAMPSATSNHRAAAKRS